MSLDKHKVLNSSINDLSIVSACSNRKPCICQFVRKKAPDGESTGSDTSQEEDAHALTSLGLLIFLTCGPGEKSGSASND